MTDKQREEFKRLGAMVDAGDIDGKRLLQFVRGRIKNAPGRPSIPEADRRSFVVAVRLTREEFEMLETLTKARGERLNAACIRSWIRRAHQRLEE